MRFLIAVTKIQVLIVITSMFLANVCLAENNTKKSQALMQKSYKINLKPGEGAFFLLGNKDDLRAVKNDYFSPSRKRYTCDRTGKIDRLLLGFLSGTNTGKYGGAKKMGMTEDEYTDRTLKLYRDLGATVVFAYHGNMTGGIGRKFATIAAKYGLPVILQPNDLYFRERRYFASKAKYFQHTNTALAKYSGPRDYALRYLIPKLKKEAPANADVSNILAWQIAEELPINGKDEDALVEYKKAFKRLLPNHLLYQIDNVQSTHKTLAVKKPPYPDICGIDRTYTWWTRPAYEPIPGLWTPHVSGRMIFNYIKDYALGAYDLFEAPSVMVMQGYAAMSWVPAKWTKKCFGLEPNEDSISPVAPQIQWVPEQKMFRNFNRHFAPKNAWRMQIWMGLARGFKGFLYFSGGPYFSREKWFKVYNNPEKGTDAGRLCLINEDFTTHRHMTEVSQTWNNIRNYESLILNTHPVNDKVVPLKIADRYIYSGILEDTTGRRYLVLVNGEIGKWDGNSPEKLNYPNTKLKLDKWAEFENYKPLKKTRTIKISLKQANKLYDLRTMTLVKKVKNTVQFKKSKREKIDFGLVRNGGMEIDKDADGVPDGWSAKNVKLKSNKNIKVSGSKSLQVVLPNNNFVSLRSTAIPVEANTKYRLKLSTYAGNKNVWRGIKVYESDGGWNPFGGRYIATEGRWGGWQSQKAEFNTRANTKWLFIDLKIKNKTKPKQKAFLYIDDVSLEKVKK